MGWFARSGREVRSSVRCMITEGDRDPRAGTGAEGQGSADTRLPFEPRKDDKTPLGDTDQHSKVPHHGATPEQEAIKREGAKQD